MIMKNVTLIYLESIQDLKSACIGRDLSTEQPISAMHFDPKWTQLCYDPLTLQLE